MKTNQAISQRIQGLRTNLGITQEELAKKVGLSRPTITLIEQGKRKLSVEDMMKFCKALECKYEDLLFTIKSGKLSNPEPKKNDIKGLYELYKANYKKDISHTKAVNSPLDDHLSRTNPYYSPDTNCQVKYEQ